MGKTEGWRDLVRLFIDMVRIPPDYSLCRELSQKMYLIPQLLQRDSF